MSTFRKVVRSVRAFQRALATPLSKSPKSTPRIGLALGGGFARGMAHIGVIKVLEEEKVPIDFVAGTSVGAIIGAVYCSGVSAKEMVEIARMMRFRDFARWTLSRYGFASNDRMTALLPRLIKARTFEELHKPLAVIATDFNSGEAVVFRSGPLIDPVRASCAYPGMFLPVNINGRLLVDGLLAHAVPAEPLRDMGADRVVAVYLKTSWGMKGGPRHIFDVIGQCFSIAQTRMISLWQKHADLVIEPDVCGFDYDAFDRSAELIRIGEESARAAMPKIKQWLEAPGAAPRLAVQPSPAALK